MIEGGRLTAARSPARLPSWLPATAPVGAAVVLAIGAALRLAMVPRAGIYHPDELFQYLEQAHRLVFRIAVVPWEHRDGIRSWILPLAVALPMRVGDWLSPGSSLYLLLPRTVVALLSLTVVGAAWALGRRQSPEHALIAGLVAATWPELVYLAPHVLSETASVALFLPAAVLVSDRRGGGRAATAGFLLAMAVLLRVQHAPAAAVLAIGSLYGRRDRWAAFAAGAIVALTVGAAVDVAMGQVPFAWALGYVRENLIAHKADRFGVSSPGIYLASIGHAWGAWTAPIFALAIVAARRHRVLFAVAVLDIVTHMLVGHKEYRFILLATTILPILAALGIGDLIRDARTADEGRPSRPLLWLALVGWLVAAETIALAGRPAIEALPDRGGPRLFAQTGAEADLCGLATVDLSFPDSGGYTYLHRAVPFFSYPVEDEAIMRAESRGFNRLILPRSTPLPAGFAIEHCEAGDAAYCIAARPGGCRPVASRDEINRQLRRRGL